MGGNTTTDTGDYLRVRRRTYLGGFGVVLVSGLAGCSGGGRPASVRADIVARDGDSEVTIVDGSERTIEDGDFYGWEFILDWEHEIEYSVEVTEGPTLGVYVIEGAEMDRLQDSGEFEAIEDAIWTDVDLVSDTVVLGAGEYWLVAVNASLEPTNA